MRPQVFYVEWIGLYEGEYDNSDILHVFSDLDKAKDFLYARVREDWEEDHRGYEDFNEYLDSGYKDDYLTDWCGVRDEYHIYAVDMD